MRKSSKNKGIAEASQKVPCDEGQLRRLDIKGITKAARDPWGRRLFGDDDIAAARAHLKLAPDVSAA